MTKRDLVSRVSNLTGMVQQDVAIVFQRMLDALADSLARGETIELRKFGVFEVTLRKARVGRNPTHPEHKIPIPARAVVKFTAGKELRERVLTLSPVPKVIADGAPKSDAIAP